MFGVLFVGVSQVIEVGQVGALQALQPSSPARTLYAHTQRGVAFGDASDILAALLAAAQQEAAGAQVRAVKRAWQKNQHFFGCPGGITSSTPGHMCM